MKYIAVIFIIAFFAIMVTIIVRNHPGQFRKWYIEQTLYRDVGGQYEHVTYLWHKGDILASWRVTIQQVNDSIKTAHYNEAKKLLDVLKK